MEERNMRNAKVSKFIAATTAATLMLSPATVFAADAGDITDPAQASSSVGGDGSLEGYVNKEVFRVVLPTVTDVNFTLDPQGLLNKADSSKYSIASGAVYFANDPTGSGTATYTNTSDEIIIYNKSSYDVEVGLSVSLDTGDIALAAQNDLANATVPSLYLGLIKDTDTAVAITDSSYESDFTAVDAVPEADGTNIMAGYEIQASQTAPSGDPNAVASPNGYYYSYGLTSGFANTDAEKITYKLEGACDSTTDWSGIDTKAVTANVAWTITKAGTPRVSGSAYSRSSTNNIYTLSNINGIKSIALSVDGETVFSTLPAAAYTLSSDKATLSIDGTKTGIGAAADGKIRYFIVTLDDDSTVTFSVTVGNTGEFNFSRSTASNTYTLTGNTQAIKSIGISVDGTTVATTMPTTSYTLDATNDPTTLTIDGTKAGIAAAAEGSIRYLIITFADNSKKILSVNVDK